MAIEMLKFDPANPGANAGVLARILGAEPQRFRDLLDQHLPDVLEHGPKARDIMQRLRNKLGPVGGGILKPSRAGRNIGSFGNMLVTATSASVSIQTNRELKNVRLYVSDPSAIMLSATSIQVNGETIDLRYGMVTAGAGATAGTAGLDLAAYRSQILDFDPYNDGIDIGDLPASGTLTLSFATGWTAGTPYVGFGFSTTSSISTAKIACACD